MESSINCESPNNSDLKLALSNAYTDLDRAKEKIDKLENMLAIKNDALAAANGLVN